MNGVKIDGEYSLRWKRVAPLARETACALLEAAGKFSAKPDRTAPYLFVNKGWVVVSSENGTRLATYLHDGNYSLYVESF